MRTMSLHWLATMAITFAVRQADKFGDSLDWDKVKADADTRIRDLVPGTFFDDFAVAFLNKVLDICRDMLNEPQQLKQFIKLLAEKKFGDAVNFLMAWVRQHLAF